MKRQIENIIELVQAKTLKAGKAEAILLELDFSDVKQDDLQACRSKTSFIDCLTAIISEIEAKADPVDILKENAEKINELNSQAFGIDSNIGKLLTESRELFDNSKDFLSWTRTACGIQKAWAYQLMSVYKNFGLMPEYQNTKASVLRCIATQDEEVKKRVHAYLQDNKKITLAHLNKLIAEVTGVVVQSAKDKKEQRESEKQTEQDKLQQATTEASESDNASTGEDERCVVDYTDNPSNTETAKVSDESQVLSKRVDELAEELALARKELNKAMKDQIAVELPQFSSDCLYARLGLSLEESKDKVKVNSSYRLLAKIYTKAKNPVIADKLLEARTALNK